MQQFPTECLATADRGLAQAVVVEAPPLLRILKNEYLVSHKISARRIENRVSVQHRAGNVPLAAHLVNAYH